MDRRLIDAAQFKIIDGIGAFSTASAKLLRNRRFRSNYLGHAQFRLFKNTAGYVFDIVNGTITLATVPEPSWPVMLGLGGLVLSDFVRRRS